MKLTSFQAAAAETAKVTDGSIDVLINNGALMVHERGGLTLDKL